MTPHLYFFSPSHVEICWLFWIKYNILRLISPVLFCFTFKNAIKNNVKLVYGLSYFSTGGGWKQRVGAEAPGVFQVAGDEGPAQVRGQREVSRRNM